MRAMDVALEGLDEAQLAAATALEGPVRIIAGAGAGKTRTVTRRIAHACASGAWDPERVLAVTFSVKAAAEMRVRLGGLGVGDRVRAATFHAAALSQLRRVWTHVCEAPFPRLAEDPRDVTARAMRRVDPTLDEDDVSVRAVRDEINWAKISLVAPDQVERVAAVTGRCRPAGLEPERFADVYDAYEREKTVRGEMDFDDILLMACHVFEEFGEETEPIRRSIGWLTVDEYQDVSPLQHRLMRLWLGDNRNVCVVGDPAQTIYSFAGASSYDLLAFADEFAPLAADISLNTDYRSTPQIVSYANRVLAASPVRHEYLRLSSGRDGGRRVERTVYETDLDEARGVAARIARLVSSGVNPSDCAILTRINAQQAVCCAALSRVGIGYRVRRDSGGAGPTPVADLDAAQRVAMAQTLRERDEARRAAGGAAGAPGHADGDLRAVMAKLGRVTVSTVHASKGLEFKHVFVIGCSEGLMPYGSPAPGDALEEERRLMYVAVTRAEDTLHMSYARSKDGSGPQQRRLSRFLS
ncbi:ATP-dependent helicase [Bifidobacterium sp. CP2]|uniref:ATP-dependent helicase n=1 Tax=Bifidobacterium TaxID=1678 RepID=UPI001BDCC2A1|nr:MULTISPECIES: ATP-dependent helicase [Bifidobacterium]MBT1180588.1 ATP-dependent helicase [Bifidobacterium sp. CP2]MBW3080433.1 ATP-dependent helicase [Bifidobacterium saguinibicoloris]